MLTPPELEERPMVTPPDPEERPMETPLERTVGLPARLEAGFDSRADPELMGAVGLEMRAAPELMRAVGLEIRAAPELTRAAPEETRDWTEPEERELTLGVLLARLEDLPRTDGRSAANKGPARNPKVILARIKVFS